MTLVNVVAVLDLRIANPAFTCNTGDGCAQDARLVSNPHYHAGSQRTIEAD